MQLYSENTELLTIIAVGPIYEWCFRFDANDGLLIVTGGLLTPKDGYMRPVYVTYRSSKYGNLKCLNKRT